MSQILVIVNPVAGGGSESDRIESWLERRPEARLRRTRQGGDARRWAREAAGEGCGLVVAAGGDGTVHEVAHGILEAGRAEVALGILPLGTGNDLIRSLGVPDDLEEALELLDRGARRSMDVIRLGSEEGEDRIVLNALTGGFSGEIHEALDEELKESWGPLSYLRSGLEMWGERSPFRLELEVDGEVSEYDALNLVVANGAYAGHGIPVAPGADPFDGLLEVVLILDASGLELSSLAARMLTGGPVEHDALVRCSGRAVEVRCAEPLPVSVDGEAEVRSSLSLRVRPRALPVVVGP